MSATQSAQPSGAIAQVPVYQSSRMGSSSACRSGDPDAFEEFFNTYKRPVYITALAITRDPFLAEEILQDCFVKAYQRQAPAANRPLAAALAPARDNEPVLQPHRPAQALQRSRSPR